MVDAKPGDDITIYYRYTSGKVNWHVMALWIFRKMYFEKIIYSLLQYAVDLRMFPVATEEI